MMDFLGEVEEALRKAPALSVVVMPDFFIDRLVSLNWNMEALFTAIMEKASRKGGCIDGVPQAILRGGNAVNTASALACLGVKVTPIICTDSLGLQLLKHYLNSPLVNFSHIKVSEKASLTTALELQMPNSRVNIMLRDIGSLEEFGPENLSNEDWHAIEDADYVCIFNWAGTRKHGTELAETVFRHVKASGRGKTYYDTADPTPNINEASNLLKKVLQSAIVDVLSLNENEAYFYASLLGHEAKPREGVGLEQLALESAELLAKHLPMRIDLHTTKFSATVTGKGVTALAPAFQVPVLRVTGAGDAWNAGNILGEAYGLSDVARLTLANAVAAYYISNPEGRHPDRDALIKFCNRLRYRHQNR